MGLGLLVHQLLQNLLGQIFFEQGITFAGGVVVHFGVAVLQVADDLLAHAVAVAVVGTSAGGTPIIPEKERRNTM